MTWRRRWRKVEQAQLARELAEMKPPAVEPFDLTPSMDLIDYETAFSSGLKPQDESSSQ